MGQMKLRVRRTDYGTVILHWLTVGSLAVAAVTGLRIATETPDHSWVGLLDLVLPQSVVWTRHMQAAVLLIAVTLAYAIYMFRAGLARRVRIDRVRLLGLFGHPTARWGTINIALYWLFYIAMLTQLATGLLLYLGYSSSQTVDLHWIGMWGIAAYGVLHVMFHWRLGGSQQLMRILRPTRLTPPPPPFDPAEVLALLDDQASTPLAPGHPTAAKANSPDGWRGPAEPGSGAGGDQLVRTRPATVSRLRPVGRAEPAAARVQRPRFRVNPLLVAIAVAALAVMAMLSLDRHAVMVLRVQRIAPAEVPVVDGEASDPIWRKIPTTTVVTEQGGNFGGTGETTVSIQAVHDGTWA